MLIGLMSDTHDNLPQIEKAVKYFNNAKVGLVLHAGDFCSPFTIDKIKALNCKFIAVFGNNDGDHEFLKRRFDETTNCEVHERFALVEFDGHKIGLLHGDEPELLFALIGGQYFEVIVHGHSHNRGIEKRGKTVLINPGEVCGYLTGKSTIATFNTDNDEAKLIDL